MATVTHGQGTTKYGPGVLITLDANELAHAVMLYLYSQNIYVDGSRTIRVDGELFRDKTGTVYVDPSGFVMHEGKRYEGRGGIS